MRILRIRLKWHSLLLTTFYWFQSGFTTTSNFKAALKISGIEPVEAGEPKFVKQLTACTSLCNIVQWACELLGKLESCQKYRQPNWDNTTLIVLYLSPMLIIALYLKAKWIEFEKHIKWLVSMLIYSGKQYPFRTLRKMNFEPSPETRKEITVWQLLKTRGHLHIMQGLSWKGKQSGIANSVLRSTFCVVPWVWLAHSESWTCALASGETSWSWSDIWRQEELMLLRCIVPF